MTALGSKRTTDANNVSFLGCSSKVKKDPKNCTVVSMVTTNQKTNAPHQNFGPHIVFCHLFKEDWPASTFASKFDVHVLIRLMTTEKASPCMLRGRFGLTDNPGQRLASKTRISHSVCRGPQKKFVKGPFQPDYSPHIFTCRLFFPVLISYNNDLK